MEKKNKITIIYLITSYVFGTHAMWKKFSGIDNDPAFDILEKMWGGFCWLISPVWSVLWEIGNILYK